MHDTSLPPPPTTYRALVADRCALARSSAGMSQSEAAVACGLKPAAISHFETAHRTPTAANLRRLARAYGVSTDYLLAARSGTDDFWNTLATARSAEQ